MSDLIVSNAAAEDRVEILDNDIHLGWVNVVQGEWSYSASQLSVGVHNFVAKYKGVPSAAWVTNVEDTEDADDLDDVPGGRFLRLQRPYYNSSIVFSGDDDNSYDPAIVKNTPGFEVTTVALVLHKFNTNLRHTTYIMDFHALYSEVSFMYWVKSQPPFGVGRMIVRAYNRRGLEVQTFVFAPVSDSVVIPVRLIPADQSEIWSLRFQMETTSSQDFAVLYIGRFRMLRVR